MKTTPARARRAVTALAVLVLAGLLGAAPGALAAGDDPTPAPGPRPEDGAPAAPGSNDWSCVPSAAHPRPVVLVHGLGTNMYEDWLTLSPLLHDTGYCVFALTYGETPNIPNRGGFLRMQDSAVELNAFVDRVLAATGAEQIDLVGHSEGTVMPQWWLRKLGGASVTHAYVTITPLFDGTTLGGLDSVIATLKSLGPEQADQLSAQVDAFCGACQQFLRGSDFYKELYDDGTIAAPGVTYTNVMTRTDELVTPYTSGYLYAPGSTNIVLQDVCPLDLSDHIFISFDPVVHRIVLNALDPEHAQPISCAPVLGVGYGGLQL
jgi:pimeloyl-ACP methyl ester carboxylesterase